MYRIARPRPLGSAFVDGRRPGKPPPRARNYTGSKFHGGSVSPRSPKGPPGAPADSRRRLSGVSPGFATGADRGEAPPDDAELFREAVRDVRPLGSPAQAAEHPVKRPRRPRPAARFARADRLAVLEESLRDDVIDPDLASGEELVFKRPGIQTAVLRR